MEEDNRNNRANGKNTDENQRPEPIKPMPMDADEYNENMPQPNTPPHMNHVYEDKKPPRRPFLLLVAVIGVILVIGLFGVIRIGRDRPDLDDMEAAIETVSEDIAVERGPHGDRRKRRAHMMEHCTARPLEFKEQNNISLSTTKIENLKDNEIFGVSFNITDGDIDIIGYEGDTVEIYTYYHSVYEDSNEEPEFELEEGIIHFLNNDEFEELSININMPYNLLDTLYLDLLNGQVEISDMSIEDATISLVNGKIDLDNVEIDHGQITANHGSIKADKLVGDTINIISDNGDIKIDEYDVKDLSGETNHGDIKFTSAKISKYLARNDEFYATSLLSVSGDVYLDLSDDEELPIFASISTETGKIDMKRQDEWEEETMIEEGSYQYKSKSYYDSLINIDIHMKSDDGKVTLK